MTDHFIQIKLSNQSHFDNYFILLKYGRLQKHNSSSKYSKEELLWCLLLYSITVQTLIMGLIQLKNDVGIINTFLKEKITLFLISIFLINITSLFSCSIIHLNFHRKVVINYNNGWKIFLIDSNQFLVRLYGRKLKQLLGNFIETLNSSYIFPSDL